VLGTAAAHDADQAQQVIACQIERPHQGESTSPIIGMTGVTHKAMRTA
jgi:hypothetical protein